MKVYINDFTVLQVLDQENNVLFEHNPFSNVDYICSDFYKEASENKTNGQTLVELIQNVIKKEE